MQMQDCVHTIQQVATRWRCYFFKRYRAVLVLTVQRIVANRLRYQHVTNALFRIVHPERDADRNHRAGHEVGNRFVRGLLRAVRALTAYAENDPNSTVHPKVVVNPLTARHRARRPACMEMLDHRLCFVFIEGQQHDSLINICRYRALPAFELPRRQAVEIGHRRLGRTRHRALKPDRALAPLRPGNFKNQAYARVLRRGIHRVDQTRQCLIGRARIVKREQRLMHGGHLCLPVWLEHRNKLLERLLRRRAEMGLQPICRYLNKVGFQRGHGYLRNQVAQERQCYHENRNYCLLCLNKVVYNTTY